jgi:hypothetical protein
MHLIVFVVLCEALKEVQESNINDIDPESWKVPGLVNYQIKKKTTVSRMAEWKNRSSLIQLTDSSTVVTLFFVKLNPWSRGITKTTNLLFSFRARRGRVRKQRRAVGPELRPECKKPG